MNYNWFKITNAAEFLELELPSRDVEVILYGVGIKTVRVLLGASLSLLYEGVMLTPGLEDRNPFAFGGYAAYRDAAEDLWLGIPIP